MYSCMHAGCYTKGWYILQNIITCAKQSFNTYDTLNASSVRLWAYYKQHTWSHDAIERAKCVTALAFNQKCGILPPCAMIPEFTPYTTSELPPELTGLFRYHKRRIIMKSRSVQERQVLHLLWNFAGVSLPAIKWSTVYHESPRNHTLQAPRSPNKAYPGQPKMLPRLMAMLAPLCRIPYVAWHACGPCNPKGYKNEPQTFLWSSVIL